MGGGIFAISILVDGGLGSGRADGGGVHADSVALSVAGLALAAVALVLAAVCLATTVISLRPAGMFLHRVPLFAWSMLVASLVWVLTFPLVVAQLVLSYVDLRGAGQGPGNATGISNGLSWMLRPPSVFAYVIPALGILGEIVPVAAKVRQKLFPVLLGAIALFGLLSFGGFAQDVESEEQFVYIAMAFALLLPVLMFLGGIADTLRRGGKNIGVPSTALLFALLGTLVVFAGVAIAAIRAIVSFELLGAAPTTAADAVFNAALLGGFAAGLGGVAWWSSKITGRAFSELGKPLALLVAGGVLAAAVPELISGFWDQESGFQGDVGLASKVETMNIISVIGVAAVALGALAFIGLLLKTAKGRTLASADPFDGHTLEWTTDSPPPFGNFAAAVGAVRTERPLLDTKEAN